MAKTAPTQGEIQSLLRNIRDEYERLRELARSGSDQAASDLAKVVDEIGEQLLVTDEELRVQHEQLAASARRLDVLAATHEVAVECPDGTSAAVVVSARRSSDDGRRVLLHWELQPRNTRPRSADAGSPRRPQRSPKP